MKIQDLRDDLAEMRYFKKSHLRKMSQQEAGSGAAKVAGGVAPPSGVGGYIPPMRDLDFGTFDGGLNAPSIGGEYDDRTGNGGRDRRPDITPEELERMLPQWLRQLNAGQIYFGPDGILRNVNGDAVVDENGNIIHEDDLFQAVDSGVPGLGLLGLLMLFLKRVGRRGMLPIPGSPDFPHRDVEQEHGPGGIFDPARDGILPNLPDWFR